MDFSEYNLSTEEAEAFTETKDRLEILYDNEIKDDYKIIRFVKANDYHIPRSVEAFKKTIEWRIRGKLDTITDDYTVSEIFKTYFPLYILGTDRVGAPVLVFELGAVDLNGLIRCVWNDDITKYITYILEVGEKYMSEHSNSLDRQKWFVLIDCKDFSPLYSANRTFRDYMKIIIPLISNHYPERLKEAYIINVPDDFNQILSKYILPTLPQNSFNKVNVFGLGGWQKQILQRIDQFVLPTYLGGTMTDVVARPSITPIVRGGKIPKTSFLPATGGGLKGEPGICSHNLKRSELYKVQVKVTEGNCIFRWDFEAGSHSIGFGLEFERDSSTLPTILIPIQRIYSCNFPESGEYFLQEAGTYRLVFDNRFSKFKSKQLFYRCSVTPVKKT